MSKEKNAISRKKNEFICLGIIIFIVLIAYGAVLYVVLEDERYILENAQSMEGIVVEAGSLKESKARGISYYQTYTISYKYNGKKYSYTFKNVEAHSRVRVGDKIEILVLPEEPDKAYRASSYDMDWIWWSAGGFVLCFLLLYGASKKNQI